MVKIKYELDGIEQEFVLDNGMDRQITEKLEPKIHKKDNDWVWIVDGPEGSGKSVLAQQLGKRLDPNFTLDSMCMTPKEFTKAVIKAKKGQCIVFDEAFTGLSSRASLSEINKLMVSLMMEMRQMNLFVIIVMPTFFLLDKYVALFRASGLFHVYLKNGNRGRWVYFNNYKKKLLYLKGKPLYSYKYPRSTLRGRFYDKYTINEGAYREKKRKALHEKSRNTKAETFKGQRDALIWHIYKKEKKTQIQISIMCKMAGFNLARNTISEIITERERMLLAEEEIEKLKA